MSQTTTRRANLVLACKSLRAARDASDGLWWCDSTCGLEVTFTDRKKCCTEFGGQVRRLSLTFELPDQSVTRVHPDLRGMTSLVGVEIVNRERHRINLVGPKFPDNLRTLSLQGVIYRVNRESGRCAGRCAG